MISSSQPSSTSMVSPQPSFANVAKQRRRTTGQHPHKQRSFWRIQHVLLLLIAFSALTSLRLLPQHIDDGSDGRMDTASDSGILASMQRYAASMKRQQQQDEQPQRQTSSLLQSSPLNPFVQPVRKFNSTLHFVVFVGLEGSGHHLMQLLVNGSHAYEDLVALNIHPTLTERMYKLLFRSVKTGDPQMALWSAPCRRSLSNHWMSNIKEPNITRIEERLVHAMQNMESKAQSGWQDVRHGGTSKQLALPVNTLFNTPSSGLLSYPSFLGPCRPLTYPNLDVWYNTICERAQVDCSHVYLYRNPYEIIKSTSVKRHLNEDALMGIHVYTTLLHVLFSQLLQHGDRTLGCINFFDSDASGVLQGGRDRSVIGKLLDYDGDDEFQKYYDSIFHPPAPFDWSTTDEVVPPHQRQYMESMVRIHDQVVKLCRQQQRDRHNSIS